MQNIKHHFGGHWTEEKLKRIEKYLRAYATIMSRHLDLPILMLLQGRDIER
jgi:hypothetical protein